MVNSIIRITFGVVIGVVIRVVIEVVIGVVIAVVIEAVIGVVIEAVIEVVDFMLVSRFCHLFPWCFAFKVTYSDFLVLVTGILLFLGLFAFSLLHLLS
ncbi:hypothetical protein F8M41_007581 [Gigaspora margarita]|uniref:Uncharacterized protein n=1 Tax=Gigaspora margarita TaxID=4874 RepID=A0A8H3X4Q6_GIGMA|nr:hypothetical protein F8M41_007581 [Gigaspora margarita]